MLSLSPIFSSAHTANNRDHEKGKTPWGELDICCLVDGKFVVGEVKDNIDNFVAGDFTMFRKVCEMICPDVALFVFNLYGYAANNPINLADPMGLCPGDWSDLLNEFMLGSEEGAYATLDSSLMFWHPFSDRYNPNDSGIWFSSAVGGPALQTVLTAGLGELFATYRTVSNAPDFVVTADGTAFRVPSGAAGPSVTEASGFQYNGGAGGNGLDPRVTGIRFMDANANQGARAIYMNESGQTVSPLTGRTLPRTDPLAHFSIGH